MDGRKRKRINRHRNDSWTASGHCFRGRFHKNARFCHCGDLLVIHWYDNLFFHVVRTLEEQVWEIITKRFTQKACHFLEDYRWWGYFGLLTKRSHSLWRRLLIALVFLKRLSFVLVTYFKWPWNKVKCSGWLRNRDFPFTKIIEATPTEDVQFAFHISSIKIQIYITS